MTDELSAPLGQERKAKRRSLLPRAVPRIMAGVLAVALAGFAVWTVVADDPLGGEPFAVASTSTPAAKPRTTAAEPKEPGKPGASAAVESAPAALAPGTQTVNIINGMNGKREQVAIGPTPAGGGKAGAVAVGAVTVEAGITGSSLPSTSAKAGGQAARAADLYASPQSKAAATTKGPRIALVVGRLGISASATSEALAKLPAAVTLGFTPYGTDVERWVLRARGEGHEVLLQVPMEPFDYPANDPGPQTLLTTLSPTQNADRLRWAMGRFSGYVGLTNYMGERFVTSADAMKPLLAEAATRGLIYFDDGTAARSTTAQAATAGGSYAKADVAIAAATAPAAVDVALARIEAAARERGTAFGFAAASPATIERINAWAKTLAARGVTLVPLTALASKPKSS